MKTHLFIIIAIVIAFGTFMLGYSLPPFLEVGFGGGKSVQVDSGKGGDADLQKQFDKLYKEIEE